MTECEVRRPPLSSRGSTGDGDTVITELNTGLPINPDPFFQKGKQGEASMVFL